MWHVVELPVQDSRPVPPVLRQKNLRVRTLLLDFAKEFSETTGRLTTLKRLVTTDKVKVEMETDPDHRPLVPLGPQVLHIISRSSMLLYTNVAP